LERSGNPVCSEAAAGITETLANKEMQMRVKIDYDLCMGDRNCNKVCPEVFEYDEDQMISRVLVDEVPDHLEGLVRRAADECAPKAIIVEE
jgi:ferredoxin